LPGRAIGANGFIYIRGEYRYARSRNRARRAYQRGYLGKNIRDSGFDYDLLIHTVGPLMRVDLLMESLEGKRGYPRIKPPFPAVVGLYGCPTIINNVETLSAVPAIIREGGEAYANRGTPKNGGTRLLCVAGHINKPGIYEIPLGMNMKKFIYEMAGGIPNGKKLKAVIPGGSSCPLMTADEIDLPMDYDSVAKAGSMMGSGGMVVMDEDTCMVDMARRIMHLRTHESLWLVYSLSRKGTARLQMLERFHSWTGPQRGHRFDRRTFRRTCLAARSARSVTLPPCLPSASCRNRSEFEDHLHGRCAYKNTEALLGAR
jgi:NADH-quinone oxidoreductase subunit F